jgi:replicative DNA helicase
MVVPHDVVNEQMLLVAATSSADMMKFLVGRAPPDHFYGTGHSIIWEGFTELVRKQLAFSPGVLHQVTGGKADLAYLQKLVSVHQAVPPNIRHHVDVLQFDKTRQEVSRGPLQDFLKQLHDTSTAPDVLKSTARKLAVAFDGYGSRRHLRDPAEIVREQIATIQRRRSGLAVFPFGLDGLDQFEDGTWRMIPGAAPGQMTVITGVPGSGKSTFTARIACALVDQGRKVLYGAWEMKDGLTLELIAGMRLGMSRTKLSTGVVSEAELVALEQEMHHVAQHIRFLAMPFGRERGIKVDNDRNLDIIHGYIADSGCDVFIADLWKRCLRHTDPDDEENALIRQQAIAIETNVHCILVQQQRAKDVEARKDKRPTREGIKGSGAWFEVPDTIIGVHRPALWKRVDDDTLEACIIKQRWGRWPLAVSFNWHADTGSITGGRSIEYDPPDSDENPNGDWEFKGK